MTGSACWINAGPNKGTDGRLYRKRLRQILSSRDDSRTIWEGPENLTSWFACSANEAKTSPINNDEIGGGKMKAAFTLIPSESRRLIAKGVAQ